MAITATAVAAVISAIASAAFALSVADSTGGQISSAIKQKDNKELIDKLSREIAQDQKLAAELVEGFNRKGTNYANQLLNRSPFSTAYHKLNDAIKKNSQNLKAASDIQRNVDIEGNKALTAAQTMPTGSGSIIGDLVAGGVASPEYKSHQTDLNNLKEKI